MHPNSIAAHESISDLGLRAKVVWQTLLWLENATDRKVAQTLGYHDMNSVRPRITELIAAGWAEEIGSTKCRVTGKTVRVVRAITEAEWVEFNKQAELNFK